MPIRFSESGRDSAGIATELNPPRITGAGQPYRANFNKLASCSG